jgi:hypothetical protein
MVDTPKPPWRWLDDNTLVADHGSRRVVVRGGKHGLATCSDDGLLISLTRNHPVARLLRAAPDLLEACGAAAVHCPDVELEDQLLRAIAKARGES